MMRAEEEEQKGGGGGGSWSESYDTIRNLPNTHPAQVQKPKYGNQTRLELVH